MDPYNDEAFCATFGKENLEKLSRLLRTTTIDDPVIDMEMEATVGDELRWFPCAGPRAVVGAVRSGLPGLYR